MSTATTELSQQTAGIAEVVTSDFASLLQQEFKPKTDKARDAVENAVRTLAEQALQGATVISGDVLGTVEGLIAELDRKLSEQINHILHHEQFQSV